MAIDPPYRFDPFQNIVNVKWLTDWIEIGFILAPNSHSSLCPASGDPPPGNDILTDFSYMSDCSCALNFDTSSAAVVRENGSRSDATGASWSYAASSLSETFSPNLWFMSGLIAGSTMIESFTVVTTDTENTSFSLYQDFKINGVASYFNMLSTSVDAWGLPGDGVTYKSGSTGFMASGTNLTFSDVWSTAYDIFQDGEIIASKDFDFSGIMVSYNGNIFDSVAIKFPSRGQTINVLCKRRT